MHLIPYAPFPPKGGGAVRCTNIALQLARYYQTKVVLFQTRKSVIDSGMDIPHFMEITSPVDFPRRKDIFDFIPKGAGLRYRWLRRSWAGPSNSIVGESYHILRKIFKKDKIDAVVLEHLEGMLVAPLIRRLSPETRIILDAHNVDHLLLKHNYQVGMSIRTTPSKVLNKNYRRIEETEKTLSQHVDAFWACSENDRNILEQLNDGLPGYTIPNGVDCDATAFRNNSDVGNSAPMILFCGSLGYEANRDGLNWFAEESWPMIKTEMPNIRLCVIGQGGNRDEYKALIQDPGVDFIGEVDSTLPYYRKASISISPLRIGSGTRLKIIETLGIGIPSVSTPLGCEGIDIEEGEHILLASTSDEFAKQCIRLVSDKKLAKYISIQGQKLAEDKYDWKIVGKKIHHSIENICET